MDISKEQLARNFQRAMPTAQAARTALAQAAAQLVVAFQRAELISKSPRIVQVERAEPEKRSEA
jgi:hypothetical protein